MEIPTNGHLSRSKQSPTRDEHYLHDSQRQSHPLHPGRIFNAHGDGDQNNALGGTINHIRGSGNHLTGATVHGNVTLGGDEADHKFLRDLHVIDPRQHKKEIEKTKGGLLEESYCWILQNPTFQIFCTGMEKRLLWIKGNPGKGKTMLLCGIIDEIAKEKSEKVSFYFCQTTQAQLRTTASVLRGLIWMFCTSHPALISLVRSGYDTKGRSIFEDICALQSLEEMLAIILQQACMQDAILIVDALDECPDNDRERLIGIITTLSESCKAKWVVSSRNWRDIEEEFDDINKESLSLELNKDSISKAVSVFIEYKVEKLTRKKGYDQNKRQRVLDELLHKSGDTFLWVALVCQELERVPSRHTIDTLGSMPEGLDGLYKRMLEKISAPSDADVLRDILVTVCIAKRPLTTGEIRLIMPKLEDFNEKDLIDAIKDCGAFITVENDTIYLVHQSAKEFLMKSGRIFTPKIATHQFVIFHRLLDSLMGLKRDIYGLGYPGIPIEEISTPNPDPLACLRYSCLHWVDHLALAGEINGLAGVYVDRFMREIFLYWLEALSLMREMSTAVIAMQMLKWIMKDTLLEGLEDLVEDGRRFVLAQKPGIWVAPLQVYVSALVFSPTGSLIHKIWSREEPEWMLSKPRVPKHWNSLMQTLHPGVVVDSLVITPDSKRLLSAAHTPGTLNVWDVGSGGCIRRSCLNEGWVQEGLVETSSIAWTTISSNGKLVVFNSGCSVYIWDVDVGRLTKALDVDGIWNFALSPSNKPFLAGISGNGETVNIWCLDTGGCVQTMRGFKAGKDNKKNEIQHHSITYSNDGRQLAARGKGRDVIVWDVATGKRIWTQASMSLLLGMFFWAIERLP